jgi:23S rRNA pseudouridine955/2504/2580 synthase
MRIVHRLDKDTSGLLIIAKNRITSVKIAYAFKHSLIKKRYLALFYGRPKAKEGWIQSEIDNTEAVSHYQVITKFADQLWCILYTPKTGKMHQIRKHALLMGGAIVGDQKYNDIYNSPYSPNLMLHASYLELPKTIENLQKNKFHSPLPVYWKQFLSQYAERREISLE